MAKLGIDLSNVVGERESKTQFVPGGNYVSKVIDTEIKETKQKTGFVLYMYSEIIEGEHKGKVFVDNLNIQNQNETAQSIGLARLKKYVDVFNLPPKLEDSEALHGKQFLATIVEDSFKNDKGEDVKSNKVKSVTASAQSVSAKAEVKAPIKKDANVAPAKKKMPWETK